MAKKLSFSIAVNLLTENFKKGTNTVKNSLRSMQMQVLAFAAALGAGGLGLSGLISRFKDVARETSRVLTALKNVSDGTRGFAENLQFINGLAKTYGLEVNALIGNFAKFTASATQANMPMEQQQKVFESLSRASTAFGLSAEDTNGVFLALSQMMGKGKISSEELRKQMGERIPIAMQAMAKAAGVSMAGLEKLLKQGKLMSSEIIPKFADALNEMIPNVDTDNLEASLNRLKNTFTEIVSASGFKDKYKALIDGLNSLLQSASKNIQNIVVGLVAAIGFVVTNGLTKVYRGYEKTGQQIVANAQVTHNKLRTAIAARLEAEKKLEELQLQHTQALGNKKIALARQIAKAEQTLSARTAQVNTAHENAKAAAAQAAAIKSHGAWATAWAAIKGSAIKLATALKSLWNTFAPAIIISGLIAIGGYLKGLYDKTKRLEKLTKDYNAEVHKEQININILFNRLRSATEGTEEYNKAKNSILSKYGEYLSGLSDEIRSLKDVEGAYKAISAAAIEAARARAIESGTSDASDDYVKVYQKNAKRLQKELKSSFGEEYGAMLFDRIKSQLDKNGDIDAGVQLLIESLAQTRTASVGSAGATMTYTVNAAADALGNIKGAKSKFDKTIEEITSIFGTPSAPGAPPTTNPIPATPEDEDDKAKRAAEKRLEAIRKLDEADRQRQIDKLAFDNDLRQKSIANMKDSFLKEEEQIRLNYDKELQAVDEYRKKLEKAQIDEAKNLYVSKHGTSLGFESFFASADLESIMPEGLKPSNVESYVASLMDAANAAFNTGKANLQEDIAKFAERERLYFASQLDQQISDIKANYKERLQQAKGNAKLTRQILKNQARETDAVILQSIQEQLEHELQYNQKVKELITDRYAFEADKRREKLAQEIEDQAKIIENIERLYDNDKNNNTLAMQLADARIELRRLNQEFKKTEFEKIREIAQGASEVFNSLRSTLDDFGLEFSENVSKALDGIGQALEGIESIDFNKISSVAAGAFKVAGGIAKVILEFTNPKSGYEKLKEKYENLIDLWDDLIGKKKQYLSESTTDEVKRAEQEASDLLQKNIDRTRELASAWFYASGNGIKTAFVRLALREDFKSIGPDIEKGLKSAGLGDVEITGIDSIWGLSAEQLQWIKDNYSDFWGAMDPVFRGYLEQIIEYGNEAIEITKIAKENLTGISFKSLQDSFLNTLADMDSEAQDFADDFSSYLQKAIMRSMLEKSYAKRLEDWYNSFDAANAKDGISEQEYNDLKKRWDGIVSDALAERDNLANILGWGNSSSASQQASTGGFQSMDQDTGNRLDGRFAALQMSGARIEGILSGISVDSRGILNASSAISSELQKHTNLFNEMRNIQLSSFYEIEGTGKLLKNIGDMLVKIDKNTSNL